MVQHLVLGILLWLVNSVSSSRLALSSQIHWTTINNNNMTTTTSASATAEQESIAPPAMRRGSSLGERVAQFGQAVRRRLSLAKKPHVPAFLRRSSITPAEDVSIAHMLQHLTPEELETAARTSYEYSQHPDEAHRLPAAKEMAKRYLRSKKDVDLATTKMKATIAFRQELDVDGLRRALDDPASPYREPLQEYLSSGMVYVQGYDKDGRATYIFEPRKVAGHDEEWTINQHVWTLERAIACSRASDKTVNAVVNFAGFSATKHAPPTSVGKQFLTTLRSHYTGHVHQIFLVDAPMAFLCLWTIFKPFVGRNTKDKIHFVSSDKQKRTMIGQLYTEEEAKPWMLPGGRKARELDLEEYLFETPFDKAFDEEK